MGVKSMFCNTCGRRKETTSRLRWGLFVVLFTTNLTVFLAGLAGLSWAMFDGPNWCRLKQPESWTNPAVGIALAAWVVAAIAGVIASGFAAEETPCSCSS